MQGKIPQANKTYNLSQKLNAYKANSSEMRKREGSNERDYNGGYDCFNPFDTFNFQGQFLKNIILP